VLSNMLQRFFFNKDLGILLIGTVIAQAIPVLASPLLTRLYTPENFAGLAILIHCVTLPREDLKLQCCCLRKMKKPNNW
jgi:hypothetical protein